MPSFAHTDWMDRTARTQFIHGDGIFHRQISGHGTSVREPHSDRRAYLPLPTISWNPDIPGKKNGKTRLKKSDFAKFSPWWQLAVARVEWGHPHQVISLLWDSLTSERRSSMLSLRQAPGHHSRRAQEQTVPGPLPSKWEASSHPSQTPESRKPGSGNTDRPWHCPVIATCLGRAASSTRNCAA